jgi:hypothetical protein
MLLEAGVKISRLDKAPDLGKSDGAYKGKNRKPRHEERREPRREGHQEEPPKDKKKTKFSEAIPSKKRPKKPADKNKGKRRKPNFKTKS